MISVDTYNQLNNLILSNFLNTCVPIRKTGTTNHNLAIKYLNETNGIELVKEVINIHNKLNIIAIVTGCFKIFLSNL